MSAALELIHAVRANGGRMRVDGDSLVIAPGSAALPILVELREHKREIIRLLEGRPVVDPESWRAPFVQWLDSACSLRPRGFGGVAPLHVAFCEWEIARDGVPCNRETFERLLEELGFLTGEIEGTMLVSGLMLRDDLDSLIRFESLTAANELDGHPPNSAVRKGAR